MTILSLPDCKLLTPILAGLSALYPSTKFCSIISDHCIENYPDKNCPTLLVYRKGEMTGQIVGLGGMGGQKATLEGSNSLSTTPLALHTYLSRQMSKDFYSLSGASIYILKWPNQIQVLNSLLVKVQVNLEDQKIVMMKMIVKTIKLSWEGGREVEFAGVRENRTMMKMMTLIFDGTHDWVFYCIHGVAAGSH